MTDWDEKKKIDIQIDEKFLEESRQMAMRLSKAMLSMEDFVKRHDEALGVLHMMILNLYNEMNKELPEHIKNYKFKTKDPWGCPKE